MKIYSNSFTAILIASYSFPVCASFSVISQDPSRNNVTGNFREMENFNCSYPGLEYKIYARERERKRERERGRERERERSGIKRRGNKVNVNV